MITLLIMAIGVIMLFLAVCVFSLGVFPILLILGFIFMFLFNVKFALLTIYRQSAIQDQGLLPDSGETQRQNNQCKKVKEDKE